MRICENGIYRDLTQSEIDEIKAQNQAQLLAELMEDRITNEDLIAVVLANVTVTKPDGQSIPASEATGTTIDLPFKAGYRWEKIISSGGISYQIVEDPDAIGSEGNPILWTEDVAMINGAFYTRDGVRYINMNGTMVEW